MSQTQPHPKNVLKNQLTRHAGCVIVIKVLRTMPKTVGAAKRNEKSPTEERICNFRMNVTLLLRQEGFLFYRRMPERNHLLIGRTIMV